MRVFQLFKINTETNANSRSLLGVMAKQEGVGVLALTLSLLIKFWVTSVQKKAPCNQ